MAQPISPQLLLFSQALFVWSVAAYAVSPDPLSEDARAFQSVKWRFLFLARIAFGFLASLLLSRSFALSFLVAVIIAMQPLVRYWLSANRTAESECFFIALALLGPYAIIRGLGLNPFNVLNLPLRAEHKAAICIATAALFTAIRGGTYIVRGVLKKAGTFPKKKKPEKDDDPVDEAELSRGRLIGSLERITLAIIAAGGSYAALGFLVAAKGVVRFEEFEQNRDFTEYFLIGSLASVLVALFAGLVIRYALLAWWPELLSLHMQ